MPVPLADLHADRAGARCTASDCRAILAAAQAAHPLAADPAAVRRRARVFRALADPTRLRILALLSVRELCLCELVDALEAAESTLVHHLRVLEEGGLVSARREGKFTYFRADAALWERYRPLDPGAAGRDRGGAAAHEAHRPGRSSGRRSAGLRGGWRRRPSPWPRRRWCGRCSTGRPPARPAPRSRPRCCRPSSSGTATGWRSACWRSRSPPTARPSWPPSGRCRCPRTSGSCPSWSSVTATWPAARLSPRGLAAEIERGLAAGGVAWPGSAPAASATPAPLATATPNPRDKQCQTCEEEMERWAAAEASQPLPRR